MESKIRAIVENALGKRPRSLQTLFSYSTMMLADADGALVFVCGESAYEIGSHPYEPRTYLMQNGVLFAAIHNAFDTRTIRSVCTGGSSVLAITDIEYDAVRMLETLACAANLAANTDIGYIEGRLAIEKMKKLNATDPENAMSMDELGVRAISPAFSHSKKLDERVMYTEDGRVYVRIKNRPVL